MSTSSQRRPSKPKLEKKDLTRLVNGEDDYSQTNTPGPTIDSYIALVKELKEFANDISRSQKPESKPPLPQWIMVVTVGTLLACLIIGIVVAVNYGNYFSKENQNTALTFVFQFPAAIVSFVLGRNTKRD
jgi:hypothetical protein